MTRRVFYCELVDGVAKYPLHGRLSLSVDLGLEETTSHLFYHCPRVRPLWDSLGELAARIAPEILVFIDRAYAWYNLSPRNLGWKIWFSVAASHSANGDINDALEGNLAMRTLFPSGSKIRTGIDRFQRKMSKYGEPGSRQRDSLDFLFMWPYVTMGRFPVESFLSTFLMCVSIVPGLFSASLFIIQAKIPNLPSFFPALFHLDWVSFFSMVVFILPFLLP